MHQDNTIICRLFNPSTSLFSQLLLSFEHNIKTKKKKNTPLKWIQKRRKGKEESMCIVDLSYLYTKKNEGETMYICSIERVTILEEKETFYSLDHL